MNDLFPERTSDTHWLNLSLLRPCGCLPGSGHLQGTGPDRRLSGAHADASHPYAGQHNAGSPRQDSLWTLCCKQSDSLCGLALIWGEGVLFYVISLTDSVHFSPQTSIDILTTVVRNTKPPLSEMLVCQAFPVVAQCILRTDDNTIMQVRLFSDQKYNVYLIQTIIMNKIKNACAFLGL